MNYLSYLHYIGLSQKNLHQIFEDNSNYENFWKKLSFEQLSKYKIKDDKVFEIMSNYKKIDTKKIDEIIKNKKITIISYKDSNYPELLKNIPNPPFVIYVRWNLRDDIKLLSIVWSRKNTRYSENVLNNIIPDLIEENFWIVSWWAFWVDSLAHNITLKNNWYTAAVIWTWIDKDYPQSNKILYEKIIEKWWAIISIFRIWTWPDNYNFPIRNEIIAWLSLWTLVTEAWAKSWTLITANLALELNRDVFAIPGDIIRETSLWSNKLIADWLAKITLSSSDILEEYNISESWNKEKNIEKIFEDEIEQLIYNNLKNNPLDSSSLADILWIDIEIIWYKLSIMEISWVIELGLWWLYYLK